MQLAFSMKGPQGATLQLVPAQDTQHRRNQHLGSSVLGCRADTCLCVHLKPMVRALPSRKTRIQHSGHGVRQVGNTWHSSQCCRYPISAYAAELAPKELQELRVGTVLEDYITCQDFAMGLNDWT